MPSISEIQSDSDAALELPQAQPSFRVTIASVSSDESSESEYAVPEPQNRPEICDLEWQREGMPDTEFNRKYPPDPWGEEMAPNARVWKIYRDQQDLSHKGMLEGWNKTLDVLLIFAGLFSAVLTAFLIESYKALQPDYTQYVAMFLYTAAVSHNRTGGVFPAMDALVAPDRFIQTSATQRLTNGLWFSSLVISLAVALFCSLIKQWLDAYDLHVSSPASSPILWARRHSLYHHGLKKWGVPMLISFLPLLLHLSVFFFFIGLILFVRPLDSTISYWVLVIVSTIGAFYALSLVLPGWRVECPSYTPLLAHAMSAVLRTLAGLSYIIARIRKLVAAHSAALNVWIWRAESWLETIQLHVGQQLERETRIISQCRHELDGYILSALIHLRIDTNRDAVNTACAAIGAVTSTRTMDVLSPTIVRDGSGERIHDIFDRARSERTGFEATSYARLCRAYWALRARNPSLWPLVSCSKLIPEFAHPVGLDGCLLQVMDFSDVRCHRRRSNIRYLIHRLQSLPSDEESSSCFPTRSMCLICLENMSMVSRMRPASFSLFLLVFCAGRFWRADTHELVRALQSVETGLRMHCSITIPAHKSGELDYICAVINSLWIMLADFGRYHLDTLTAQIVSHQVAVCFRYVAQPLHGFSWTQLSGLSIFVRSSAFGQCAGIGHNLAQYILLFRLLRLFDITKVPLDDYWACRATLFKLCWNCVPLFRSVAYIISNDHHVPFDLAEWDYSTRRSTGRPYVTQDDWYEPVLSAFLTGKSAVATWTAANSPDQDGNRRIRIRKLADLALRISMVLCRRKHLGRANDVFLHGFFSGTFLLARFRDFVSLADTPRQEGGVNEGNYVSEAERARFEDRLLAVAKHCLKLSPDALLDICAQLEETGDMGSEVRTRAVAFAQRIRHESAPGGVLSAECSADCPCMITPTAAVPSRRTLWGDLVARFRPSRREAVTSPNV